MNRKSCLVALGVLVLLGVAGTVVQRFDRAERKRATALAEVDASAPGLVAGMEKAGVIARYTCSGNEAYVRPLPWSALNVDQKRGVTGALAIVCDQQKSGRRMTVYDHQSGRRLMSYSGGSFTTY